MLPARMIFPDIALARRIEAAERDFMVAAGEAARGGEPGALVIPVAGGAAVFAGAGAPWNKLVGLGFEGVPEEDVLSRVEREFARRKAPLQVELSTLGDPAVATLLTERGYRLLGFEDVLGLRLSPARPASTGGTGTTAALMAEGETRPWLDAMVTGFAHADTEGVQSHESFPRDVLERVMAERARLPGFRGYLARRGGEVAGAGGVYLAAGVAILCGAATLPQHRRRGVQTALLAERLSDAAAAGCDLAVVTTQPGSKSQENVMRQGFSRLYTRAHLVLAAP